MDGRVLNTIAVIITIISLQQTFLGTH